MIKQLAILSILATFGFSRMIGGVSILVDGEPITTYELKAYSKATGASTNDAVSAMIQKKLEDMEIRKLGLVVTQYEIDQQIIELADRNKLTVDQFKAQLKSEGQSEKELRNKIAQKIQKDRLYQQILASKMKQPTEAQLRRFYHQHEHELNIPAKADVTQYVSESKKKLIQQSKSPSKNINGVMHGDTTIDLKQVPQGLAMVLIQTPKGKFTPAFDVGGGRYVILRVKRKYGGKTISFEEAKPKLLNAYMKEREQAGLIEYFEKKKSEANIKIVRKP